MSLNIWKWIWRYSQNWNKTKIKLALSRDPRVIEVSKILLGFDEFTDNFLNDIPVDPNENMKWKESFSAKSMRTKRNEEQTA